MSLRTQPILVPRAPVAVRGSRRSPPSAPPGTAPRSGSRAPVAPATHGPVTAAAAGAARCPRPARPPRYPAVVPAELRLVPVPHVQPEPPHEDVVGEEAGAPAERPARGHVSCRRTPLGPALKGLRFRPREGASANSQPRRKRKAAESPVLPGFTLGGFVISVTPPRPGSAARPLPRSPRGRAGPARSGSGRRRFFADAP